MSLSGISIQYVKGVGPARKKLFQRLGVETVEDLLYLFPRRYEDRREMTPLARVNIGEFQTICGKVAERGGRRSWYTKKHVLEVILDDGTGRVFCVWFNQPYLENYFRPGRRAVCYGKVEIYKDRLQMVSPEYELIGEGEEQETLSIGRIVPIYPLTRGMTHRYLRKVIHSGLERYRDQLEDELPVSVRNKHRLYNIKRSLENIHFPNEFSDQEEALRRISFEEFYFFQVSVILRRLSMTRKKGIRHEISDAQALAFLNAFPFELTAAQKRVIREIRRDMEKETPMLRLLQGDVGSGKTAAALFGCAASARNGFQSCLMAPTEILARQHYENIQNLLGSAPAGARFPLPLRTALLTGGTKKSEKEKLLKQIREGEIDLVVGTHALMQEDVQFRYLSFVVIDEQHKFGVRQRALLAEKGSVPDVLVMTATPIPRTLCLSLYGDLDISVIDEMPPGRGTIETRLYSHDQTEKVYALIREKVKEGRQAYLVYPLIEESEALELKAAQAMFKHFQKNEFKDLRLGLIHGRMKLRESGKIMEQFKRKELDILVATTVVEVGVDVPSANVMLIEHAERFGLAQLHQLRGRIGRGEDDALCLLVSDPATEEARARLEAILSTSDGFKIAEQDLMIRGPGQFFGRHQHGLNELKVANPVTQLHILETAREEVKALLAEDPKLQKDSHARILELVRRRYPTYLAMAGAG